MYLRSILKWKVYRVTQIFKTDNTAAPVIQCCDIPEVNDASFGDQQAGLFLFTASPLGLDNLLVSSVSSDRRIMVNCYA